MSDDLQSTWDKAWRDGYTQARQDLIAHLLTAAPDPPVPPMPEGRRKARVPSGLLTMDEAAERLRISRSALYELLKNDGLPSVKIGRRRLVSSKALDEWLDGEA